MTEPDVDGANGATSEDSEISRAVEIAALSAQLFFLAMLCAGGWFVLLLIFGTFALGTGPQPWVPIALWTVNILVPIIYIVIAWFIYRRWKTL